MWGQSWGQMIWGQVQAVPALGFWGTILLGAVLGALGTRRLRGARPRRAAAVALAVALLVPISARALPFVFSNGTVADATQVNANFAALASQQGLAPATAGALVDLQAGSNCGPGTNTLTTRTNASGSVTFGFTAPSGQTLVVTDIGVSLFLGTSNAGHLITVTMFRTHVDANGTGANQGSFMDQRQVTLDAHGAGLAAVTYGAGSAYAPGMAVCVSTVDAVTGGTVPATPTAHGFLTAQ
jgi:hypothetical protein